MSLISRKLLTPDEVLKIGSPNIVVMIPGEKPALLIVPDISRMHFNKLNGMGTKEENQKLRVEREKARKVRKISKIKIWDIWNRVKDNDLEEIDEDELQTIRKILKIKNEEGVDSFETKKSESK